MSELSRHLELELTGRSVAHSSLEQILCVKETVEPASNDIDQVYILRSKFYCSIHLRTPHDQEEIIWAKSAAQQRIVECVFGEFRRPLHELKIAVWNSERNRALELIESLFTEMFD